MIHVVMMRRHKAIHAVALSFNLSVEKCCCRREILVAECWYKWACGKSHRPVSTEETEAEINFI